MKKLILVILLYATPVFATDYYVSPAGQDTNDGSTSSPFKTIRHGVGVLKPGDKLVVRGGIYANDRIFEVDFTSSGSVSQPISIVTVENETVILPIQIWGDNLIRFQDGSISYIIIKGFILDGTGGMDEGAGGTLVYFDERSHNLHLENLEIRDSTGPGLLIGGVDHVLKNLNVHSNGTWDGYSTGSNGLYLTGDKVLVDGGKYWDNEAFGVRVGDSNPTQSGDGVTVRNIESYQNGSGIGLGGKGTSSSGGGGIVIGDNNHLVYNNKIHNNYSGILLYGFGKKAIGNKFYYNTVIGNSPGAGIEIQSLGQDTELINNIFWQNASAIVNNGAGTIQTTNMVTNPDLDSNYKPLPGSKALDAGTLIPAVTTDFIGTTRPQGKASDLGVYEVVVAPPPTSPVCVVTGQRLVGQELIITLSCKPVK